MQLLPYSCLWPETTCFSWIKITQGVTFHVFYFTRINWIWKNTALWIIALVFWGPDTDLWLWHLAKRVLGGRSSWLICWYSQKADMATTVPGPKGTPAAVLALTHLLGTSNPAHFSPFIQGQPSPEEVDSHRLCSFYSSHPQQRDLGRKHCQKSVTRDLIRQAAFNLISSTTSTFFFL